MLWLSYGHTQTFSRKQTAYSNGFTPKLLRFQGAQITVSDSTSKVMALSQLQTYLSADSAVLISMRHFRNQNDQLGKMTSQILDQDTTIKSLTKSNAIASQEIKNRDGIIEQKDFQLENQQGIIDGGDQRLKNCQKAGWRRTWIGGGIGVVAGILVTVITFVAVR